MFVFVNHFFSVRYRIESPSNTNPDGYLLDMNSISVTGFVNVGQDKSTLLGNASKQQWASAIYALIEPDPESKQSVNDADKSEMSDGVKQQSNKWGQSYLTWNNSTHTIETSWLYPIITDNPFPKRSHISILNLLNGIQNIILYSYLSELDNIRMELQNVSTSWTYTQHKTKYTAIACYPDYFKILSKYEDVKTVFFNTTIQDVMKHFQTTVYEYASSHCLKTSQRFKGKNRIKGQSSRSMYLGLNCSHDINVLWKQTIVNLEYFKPAVPYRPGLGTKDVALTYIHIIKNTVVTPNGDVFMGNLRILIRRCKMPLDRRKVTKPKPHTIYEEVLTLSQFWAGGFFHGFLEQFVKLAPYINFLKDNPHIKIHVFSKASFIVNPLKLLGINPDRLVTGTVGAKLLYMPAGTPCGRPGFLNAQLLSLQFRNLITRPAKPRNTILLIKRPHIPQKRYFIQHKSILKLLQNIAANYNLNINVFTSASLNRTISMFNQAFLVVAPHGAGLSNMIFSEPGTVIIESAHRNTPICYMHLSAMLGLRHYMLEGNVYHTTPKQLKPIVEHIVKARLKDKVT